MTSNVRCSILCTIRCILVIDKHYRIITTTLLADKTSATVYMIGIVTGITPVVIPDVVFGLTYALRLFPLTATGIKIATDGAITYHTEGAIAFKTFFFNI